MIVKCKNCMKEVNKPPSQIKKSKSGNHFCSRSCASKVNNTGRQRNPPKERTCNRCDIKYFISPSHQSTRLCGVCAESRRESIDNIKNLTLKEYREKNSVKGKHRSWANVHVRNFTRSWNRHLQGKSCENCGYDKHTEFCHIIAVCDFPEDTQLKVVNSEENIAILCRNCHWEFDKGLLTIRAFR